MDFRSNVIVVPRYRLAFFAVEKCASTSIKKALRSALTVEGERWHRTRDREVLFPVFRPWQMPDWDGYLSMMVVRHPLARLASTYCNKIRPRAVLLKEQNDWMRPGMSFKEFALGVCARRDFELDRHLRSQSYRIDKDQLPREIMRFERLADEWRRMQQAIDRHCGLVVPDLLHLNPSGVDRDLYTPDLAERVRTRYRIDMELFEYD